MFLKLFTEHFPIYVELMKSTEHNSPYHAEGSVWTHTCMVYSILKSRRPDSYVPQIAAILHDLGKCMVKITKDDGSFSFKGHEGVSTHLALDILPIFGLSDQENIQILNLISLHGVNVEQLTIPYMDLFRHADAVGRISLKDIRKDYDPRKFLKQASEYKREVTILTGLPCSGKSTYASQFKDTHNIVSRDTFLMDPIINPDDLPYNEIYNLVHSDEVSLACFNNLFESHILKVSKDYSTPILVDMTMLSLSSRRSMMAKLPNSSFKSVVFLTRLTTIDARNENRPGKVIPDEVLFNMQKSFTMPVREEGFTSIEYKLS